MELIYWKTLLTLLGFLFMYINRASGQCPRVCECTVVNVVNNIHVKCLNLNSFPNVTDYPTQTKRIEISVEGFGGIPARAFSGLYGVQDIILKGDIGDISPDAFLGIQARANFPLTLTFTDGKITKISQGAFQYLKNIATFKVVFFNIIIELIDTLAFDNSNFESITFDKATITKISGFAFRSVETSGSLVIRNNSAVNIIETCAFSGVEGIKRLWLKDSRFNTIAEYGFADVTMYDTPVHSTEAEVKVENCNFPSLSPDSFNNMRGVEAYVFTANAISVHLKQAPLKSKQARLCFQGVPIDKSISTSNAPTTESANTSSIVYMSTAGITGSGAGAGDNQPEVDDGDNTASKAEQTTPGVNITDPNSGNSTGDSGGVGLSTTAIVLICIAVALVILLIILIVLFVVRQNNAEKDAVGPEKDGPVMLEPEY